MKSTDKVPVKQPGEESRSRKVDVEEIWHEDIGYVLFEELNLEARKKTSPMLLGSKKKPPQISATVTKDLLTSDKVEGQTTVFLLLKERPCIISIVLVARKIYKTLMKIHKSTHSVVNIKSRQKKLSETLEKKNQNEDTMVENLEKDI